MSLKTGVESGFYSMIMTVSSMYPSTRPIRWWHPNEGHFNVTVLTNTMPELFSLFTTTNQY